MYAKDERLIMIAKHTYPRCDSENRQKTEEAEREQKEQVWYFDNPLSTMTADDTSVSTTVY